MYRLLSWTLLAAGSVTAQSCRQLVLPWHTYNATLDQSNVCEYRNVRFASPPTGSLRFSAPKYPPSAADPPAPAASVGCIAMNETPCLVGPPGASSPDCFPPNISAQNEDCLFLDIYVPPQVFTAPTPANVIVWLYGGAFVFGSKTQYNFSEMPLYDAEWISEFRSGNSIVVTGNYRLGAFGWLAGSYMETNAQPNAGLLDQRAILQFVKDHIAKLNGSPSAVSLWGESAGASSIMHHLVMPENIKNPLFQNALLQSPAYQWMWDRTGALNQTFQGFAEAVKRLVGCKVADISCLRGAPISVLSQVNQALFQEAACMGIMPLGPSVDGKLVLSLAPNMLRAGKFTKLKSILVSHVGNEVPYSNATKDFSFIPLPIRDHPKDARYFDRFIQEFAAGTKYKDIWRSIENQYPSQKYPPDQIARAAAVIRDSSFTCHTRFLIDAYSAVNIPTYALDYTFGGEAARHASDLLPLFSNKQTNYQPLFGCLLNTTNQTQIFKADYAVRYLIGSKMHQYFPNQALFNNPNAGSLPAAWSPAKIVRCAPNSQDTCVGNLMTIITDRNPWINNTVDYITNSTTCEFWAVTAQRIMKIAKATADDLTEADGPLSIGPGPQYDEL